MARESLNGRDYHSERYTERERDRSSDRTYDRTSDRTSDRNGDRNGDRSHSKERSRESSSVERINRDTSNTEKLIYALRSTGTTVELYSGSLECLQQGKYLNDEVVQVYLAYLMNEKCDPYISKRTHIFDSCYYTAIKETFTYAREPKMSYTEVLKHKQAKWMQLCKWYNGVDIFNKRYLIFPICDNTHWYAIIVCYPMEVKEFNEEPVSPDQSSESRNKPVAGIIILDSLALKQPLLTKEIRNFLDFQWRTRLTVIKDFSWHNLKEYRPTLPKQTNSFDCGIFMLAYLKAFLKQPEEFYKCARRNRPPDVEELAAMVKIELGACSREFIKSTIKKKCQAKPIR